MILIIIQNNFDGMKVDAFEKLDCMPNPHQYIRLTSRTARIELTTITLCYTEININNLKILHIYFFSFA